MKASWSGYLHIGELAIPVRLYNATRTTLPRFIQLHAADHGRIRRPTICELDGKPIEATDMIHAVEYNGKLVELTDAELHMKRSAEKYIMVRQFANAPDIDPAYYERPYYIVPSKGGDLAYTILREAFGRTHKVAIAVFVFYEREHLAVIRPWNGMLMLEQLRFATELMPRSDLKTPSLPQPAPEQVDLAAQLIERYSAPFYTEDYRNEQADYLEELIDRKSKGLPMKRPPRIAPQATPEGDITTTLQSLLHSAPTQPLLDASAPTKQ